ncbi:hypothetical protein ILUMI_11691 [Ignelater luminosus]|uniref:WAP domain-containing protein n=1 Tax=Ignelater luminosus TaxID=2038154 RepID=A0A8K0CZV4_IGNLU|nr:hypothetical protein ILUMI_11691 [Ignelater luminosus]
MRRVLFGCLLLLPIITVVVNGQRKPGTCPPPANVGVCALTCMQDNQCAGNAKCCRTSCGGSICARPVLPPPPQTDREKPGTCPEQPEGPWVCSSRCSKDADCRGAKKCCKNRCGAMACMKAE